MKTKLEDIARKYANTKSHSTGSKFVDCMEDYTAGFTEASEQSNQAIQELVQFITEFRDKNFSKDGNLTGHH